MADTTATLQEVALAAIVVAILRQAEHCRDRLAWLSTGLGTRLASALLSASLFIAAVGGHEH